MGGVDLNDQLKSTHKQDRQAKWYYLRLAFDMFDQLMVNSSIVYNTLNPEDKLSAKDYQLKISEGIVAGFSSRSSDTSTRKISQQLDEIQLDLGAPHLSMWGKRYRCRCCYDISKKEIKSFVYCSECKDNFCLNKDRNCFYTYHTTL